MVSRWRRRAGVTAVTRGLGLEQPIKQVDDNGIRDDCVQDLRQPPLVRPVACRSLLDSHAVAAACHCEHDGSMQAHQLQRTRACASLEGVQGACGPCSVCNIQLPSRVAGPQLMPPMQLQPVYNG